MREPFGGTVRQCTNADTKGQMMVNEYQIDVAKYQAQVSRPGKFESEPAYAPYFWHLVPDGESLIEYFGDDADEPYAEAWSFEVNADEAEAFGLGLGEWITVTEDSQGFVLSWKHSTRDEAARHFRQWLGLESKT